MYSIVPTSAPDMRHAVAFQRARQSEIHHQDAAVLVPHHVLRLQVAVNHAHACAASSARHTCWMISTASSAGSFLSLDG